MSRKSRRCWSKSIGERGHRVRLYEARPGGPIMRSVFVNGKEVRKSLGHRDKEQAVRQGYELLTALLANEEALDEHSLTLGLLADLYLESPAHLSKKPRTQRAESQILRRVVEFFGRTRRVDTLSESDVKRYTMARRRGDVGRPVGDRTIGADLEMLLRAIRWAVRERKPNGERLLKENPLLGVRLPSEKNPQRPVMKHDEYLRLLEVAQRVHPLLKLALIVAEGTRPGRDHAAAARDVASAASEVGNRAEGLSREGRRGSRGLEGRRDDAQGLPAGGPGDDSECRATPDPSPRESVSGEKLTTLLTTHRMAQKKRCTESHCSADSSNNRGAGI